MTRPLSFAIFLTLLLLPWAWFQSQYAINSDAAWLSIALERLLQGHGIPEYVYEPNPPLNIFIYSVPYAISHWLGLPLDKTIFGCCLLFVALQATACWMLMRDWRWLTGQDRMALLTGFTAAGTVLTSLSFGERDHLVILALVPFLLAQANLTLDLDMRKALMWPVLITGAVLVMLKPHYGLLPALLLTHRLWRQRRPDIVFNPDFLCLALVTALYVTAIWIFFPGYVYEVLPDVKNYYFPAHSPIWIRTLCAAAAAALPPLAAYLFRCPAEKRKTVLILSLGAAVCLIPYYLQGRGFYYHLLPALTFFVMACSLVVQNLAERFRPSAEAVILSMLAIVGVAFIVIRPVPQYPHPVDYAHFPLSKIVSECRGTPDCSFLMFNDSMGVATETAFYTGVESATRFPSFWFLPVLLKTPRDEDFQRFARMIAEDLERYKPRYIFLGRFSINGGPVFDFQGYFSRSEAFQKEWRAYQPKGSLSLDMHDYYPGTALDDGVPRVFDIYTRQSGL